MSNLLKMYRALEDKELAQRIQGAAVKYAHYLTGHGNGGSDEAFARTVLADPFRQWQDMHIEVVTNTTVMDNILTQADGTVYTGNIPDKDIEYVVEITWPKLANKYAPQPEAGE